MAEKEDKIKEVLEMCKETFESEGGNIEFVNIDENNNVHVNLTGPCSMCPSSTMELKMEVEEYLKDAGLEINEVIQDNKADYSYYDPFMYYNFPQEEVQ